MNILWDRWHRIRKESFVKLVFFRGFLQFGVLTAGFFILLSAVTGDGQFISHGLRALVVFPIVGLFFGAALWLTNRVLHRSP